MKGIHQSFAMGQYRRHLMAALSPLSLIALTSTPAQAQNDGTSADERYSSNSEIIVTAQRRETRLQETPVVVTAFNQEMIAKNSVHYIEDIARTAPGITVPGTQLNNNATIAIRGITFFSGINSVSYPVAFYIDGLFTDRPFNIRENMFDLERIEVLRGPQGVLFGRNATAGAVIISHRLPGETFRALGALEAGSFGTVGAQASVSGPLVDGLSVGIAGSYRKSDGYVRNVATGNDVFGEDSRSIRGTIRARPTSNLELILRGGYSHEISTMGQKNIAGFATIDDAINNDPALGPLEINNDFGDAFVDRTLKFASLETILGFDNFDITAQIGVQHSHQFSMADSDGTGVRISENVENNKNTTSRTAELRASSTNDSPFQWDVGVFYINEHPFENDNHVYMYSTPTSPRDRGNDINLHETIGNSYAIFAHIAYDITDQLTLRVGGRYSHDRKKFNSDLDLYTPGGIVPRGTRASASWEKFTPLLGLDYRITPDVFAYLTASEGYKSGGFNLFGDPFDPETVWNYEGGLKIDFAGGLGRLNTAVFYMDYSDIQVSQNVVGGLSLIQNAAESTIYGVEMEGLFQPVEALRFDASLAWLHANYDQYILNAADPIASDIGGQPINYAPEWKWSVSGEYTAHLTGGLDASFRLSYSYEDPIYFVATTQPGRDLYRRGSVHNLGARVSLGDPDDQWEVAFIGRNLTNQRYFGALQNLLGGANRAGYYAPPRYLGVELRFKK